MINDQLLNYIKQQLSLNITKEVITGNLKTQGWTDQDVGEAFLALSNPTPVPTNIPRMEATTMTPTTTVDPASISSVPKSRKGLFVSIIIILLLLAGGGLYGYYSGYFSPLSNIFLKSVDNVRLAQSAGFDVVIEYSKVVKEDVEQSGLEDLGLFPDFDTSTIKFTTTGKYDFYLPENKKSYADLFVEVGSLDIGAEIRTIDNNFYAQITKLPSLSLLAGFSDFEKKWIYFPLSSKEDGEETETNLEGSPLDMVSEIFGVDSKILELITPEQKEAIYNLTKNAKLITVVDKFTPEKINDVLSYHFAFVLNKEGITEYINSLKNFINEIGKDNATLSSFDPTDIIEDLELINNFLGEAWIGKENYLPYKLVVSLDNMSTEGVKESDVKITAVFKDWDLPQGIEAPLGALSLEEFFATFVESSPLGDARNKGADAAIKANLASARAQAEIYYDKSMSYSGVCSNGDNIQTYAGGIKDILSSAEDASGSTVICKDSKNEWAASAKLKSDGYWCVDSKGFAYLTASHITTTKCPVKK